MRKIYGLGWGRTPLPVHKEIKLDSKLLDRLVGKYTLSPELVPVNRAK